MPSRPSHLSRERADRFQHQPVVDAYPLRWPYPPEVFELLAGLMVEGSSVALDVGTGTGDIARPLVTRVGRVDAVDLSAPMLARARTLPGGDHAGLRWFEVRAEDFAPEERYGLITAAESLHWMDWDVVLPRFHEWLVPGGSLAIIERREQPAPWDGLGDLIGRYSTVRDWQAFELIAELERRGLFRVAGRQATSPVPFRQSLDDYVESFHSRSSLSRASMLPADADAFDRELREIVAPWSTGGEVELQTVGEVVWGVPLPG